jgi:hypothetical protein
MVQAMAKHASHILDIARKVAEHRYKELKGEIATLMKNFPHRAAAKGKRVSRAAAAALMRGRKVVGAAIAGDPHHRNDRCRPRPEKLSALPSASVGQNEGSRGEQSVTSARCSPVERAAAGLRMVRTRPSEGA